MSRIFSQNVLLMGMLLCIPIMCNAMQLTVASTETLREVVSPKKLNRMRPENPFVLDQATAELFLNEFTIDPDETFIYSMYQDNVYTLRSIDTKNGKKITRKIVCKKLVPQKK